MDELVTGLVNQRSAAFGQLESHRRIRFTRSEIELGPDGRVRIVLVLYTDLELSTLSPVYDANAVELLIGRIKAFQKAHHQLIRLKTLSGTSPGLEAMQDAACLGMKGDAPMEQQHNGERKQPTLCLPPSRDGSYSVPLRSAS
jgi:hypothetical protein